MFKAIKEITSVFVNIQGIECGDYFKLNMLNRPQSLSGR